MGMPRGRKTSRLPAADTCRVRSWGPGTVLASTSWSREMLVVEVLENWVRLQPLLTHLDLNSLRIGSASRYASIPTDVHTVEAGATCRNQARKTV